MIRSETYLLSLEGTFGLYPEVDGNALRLSRDSVFSESNVSDRRRAGARSVTRGSASTIGRESASSR